MRHLTRTLVTVQTRKPLPDLSTSEGVHSFKNSDNVANKASFSMDSDKMAQLMLTLAPLEIIGLQSTPPTLEDLFLRYYQKDEQGDGQNEA